jgi:hypothetical protein
VIVPEPAVKATDNEALPGVIEEIVGAPGADIIYKYIENKI